LIWFDKKLTMRWSQYFIPTLREDPADAGDSSHELPRARHCAQLTAGISRIFAKCRNEIL